MAFRHGKDTVVKLEETDISGITNQTAFNDGKDTHDTTTYGNERKTYIAGLGDGTVTISGNSSDGPTGARAIIEPLMDAGDPVAFTFQPYGTGTGLAQTVVDVIVSKFNESNPVADKVAWTAELQMTGPKVITPQV